MPPMPGRRPSTSALVPDHAVPRASATPVNAAIQRRSDVPIMMLTARGDEADRAFWRSAMAGDRTSDDDLAHAVTLLRSTDALSDTIERARQFFGGKHFFIETNLSDGPSRPGAFLSNFGGAIITYFRRQTRYHRHR